MSSWRGRSCDVCHRPISATPWRPWAIRAFEIRVVLTLTDPNGDHGEADGRYETCSPACAATAMHATIERAEERCEASRTVRR